MFDTHTFEDCILMRETEKAVLVKIPEADDAIRWIPKSLIDSDSEIPGEQYGCLIVARWWAEENDLIE